MFALEPAALDMLRESKRLFTGLWDGLPVLDEP
jgi:hypothetical protein